MRLFSALALLVTPALALASGDPVEGRKIVAETGCETCHHNRTMGDAKAIYLRNDRKVTSLAQLKARVALCNSELNLKLFPEDEEHIVAYLDQEYYRFSTK